MPRHAHASEPAPDVLYVPHLDRVLSAWDYIDPQTGRGGFAGNAEGDVVDGTLALQRCSADEFRRIQEDAVCGAPVQVTQEAYDEALFCLPPARTSTHGFAMGEPLVGRVYAHYVALGGSYWMLHRPITTAWDAIIADCRHAAASASPDDQVLA